MSVFLHLLVFASCHDAILIRRQSLGHLSWISFLCHIGVSSIGRQFLNRVDPWPQLHPITSTQFYHPTLELQLELRLVGTANLKIRPYASVCAGARGWARDASAGVRAKTPTWKRRILRRSIAASEALYSSEPDAGSDFQYIRYGVRNSNHRSCHRP